MIDVKIIDKAKKLKELADRGIGGEKENAIRMYEAHKQKHNLTDDQVTGRTFTSYGGYASGGQTYRQTQSNRMSEQELAAIIKLANLFAKIFTNAYKK